MLLWQSSGGGEILLGAPLSDSVLCIRRCEKSAVSAAKGREIQGQLIAGSEQLTSHKGRGAATATAAAAAAWTSAASILPGRITMTEPSNRKEGFKKCRSATFSIDGYSFTIGERFCVWFLVWPFCVKQETGTEEVRCPVSFGKMSSPCNFLFFALSPCCSHWLPFVQEMYLCQPCFHCVLTPLPLRETQNFEVSFEALISGMPVWVFVLFLVFLVCFF